MEKRIFFVRPLEKSEWMRKSEKSTEGANQFLLLGEGVRGHNLFDNIDGSLRSGFFHQGRFLNLRERLMIRWRESSGPLIFVSLWKRHSAI